MIFPGESARPLWHTGDLLIRLARGEVSGLAQELRGGFVATSPDPTLALVSSNPALQEKLSVLRSPVWEDRTLVIFGARTGSIWALDALVGRHTHFAHDWSTLRAEIMQRVSAGGPRLSVLDEIGLDHLYAICEILHERDLDHEAEGALLQVIAARVSDGDALAKKNLDWLIGWLLQAELDDAARTLVCRLADDGWLHHAFRAELQHPRFGGSFESMLLQLNATYRRHGIEPVTLDDGGDFPFCRLHAGPQATVTGPLVTVIMTSARPGPEIITAARSIVAQTYQNWELVVSDDGSPAQFEETLSRLAALDSRIRIIRNESTEGISVRRNEAIQAARGELVAMQSARGWSHPHRLEVQVHDLITTSMHLANVIHAANATEDLSFVSARGAALFADDASLMFRREPVIAAVGFYDSVSDDADREFRERIEAATTTIPALASGVPLQIELVRNDTQRDDGRGGIWTHPDRMAYLSATRRFAKKIERGERDPHVAFPLAERAFPSPAAWLRVPPQRPHFDLLVVTDARVLSSRESFLHHVVEELRAAVAAGLSVAIAQSDSLMGPRALAFFPDELQDLVDTGAIERVSADEEIEATVAVIRNAGAAQGHPAERWAASVQRAVIVEDASASDVRGRTVALPDVAATVDSWFGVEPEWVTALPALPIPSVTAIFLDTDHVRLILESATAARVRSIRLTSKTEVVTLESTVVGTEFVSAEGPADSLQGRDWTIVVESDAGGGAVVSQQVAVSDRAVIWNRASRVVLRSNTGNLRVLPAEETADLPSSRAFAAKHLSVDVELARVVGSQFEVAVTDATPTLKAVYALRDVDGTTVRRRDFHSVTSEDGRKVWQRPLTKFAESRWRLFGTFDTPLGPVEFPIRIDGSTKIEGTPDWRPQVLSNDRVLVAPPAPGRILAVRRRVARAMEKGRPSGRGTKAVSRHHLGPEYGVPRIDKAPVVSVVMPVYNVEPYLEHAITSVLGQDFSDLELIIVDDASTDNGRNIIEKYWKSDPRVRVFGLDHNTLGGAGIPSNIGVRAARGTYVAFADSDDHVSQTGLAKLVEQAEAHSAELVIGDFRTFNDTTQDGFESYDRAVWAELPLGEAISAFTHPALFRLSAVPWRKLYRGDFLKKYRIQYPEGDYFYEDNPLHWFVLARAHRVVMCDEIISFHRMEREGQTMSAQTYKLGAFVNHANTIFNFLNESTDKRREALFEAFFNFLDRTQWTATRQTQPAAEALVRRGFGDVYRRALTAAPNVSLPARSRAKLEASSAAYPDVDLTVVIPVFNSSDLLRRTLDSVLALRGFRFNVLLVDDGSTDDSLEVMREYEVRHDNVHVFAQGNRGAGRARNSVIPLCSGRYTYFLDADDIVDARALAAAVRKADADSSDLLFTKYRIDYVDEGRTRGVFDADLAVWDRLPHASSNAERQRLVAQLINYPWNRIIRTSLLHDANMFFGATVVHNDVLFHWHSIASAQHIGYLDLEVCTHRKFGARQQVTNVSDERRLAVLEALRATHERISQLDAYPNVEAEWKAFALHLLEWAKDRVPESLHAEYKARSSELTSAFAVGRVGGGVRR